VLHIVFYCVCFIFIVHAAFVRIKLMMMMMMIVSHEYHESRKTRRNQSLRPTVISIFSQLSAFCLPMQSLSSCNLFAVFPRPIADCKITTVAVSVQQKCALVWLIVHGSRVNSRPVSNNVYEPGSLHVWHFCKSDFSRVLTYFARWSYCALGARSSTR